MLRSRCRVEWTEEESDGVYFHYARESGTEGDGRLGKDVADAVGEHPRPLLVLAKAVLELYDRVKDKGEPPTLFKAAKKYADDWAEFDRFAATNPPADKLIDKYPK